MSLKTWAGFRVSADNAHGVIRPTGRSGCRRAPGPPESLAGQATAPGFSSPTPPARRRTSPAGGAGSIAQGAQFVEADAGEDFHTAPRIGAAQACSSSLARPARALAPTVEALPLMVCRVAALPGHRPRRAGVRAGRRGPACPERSAATPGRSAPGCRRNARRYRPAPRPVRPRPLPLPARPWRRSCRDDRAGKAPGAPCRSASPHGRSCPPPGRLRGRPARRWRSWQDRQPGEAPVGADSPGRLGPSISGICMSISTASNGTLASSTC